jgi:hypothetical protein
LHIFIKLEIDFKNISAFYIFIKLRYKNCQISNFDSILIPEDLSLGNGSGSGYRTEGVVGEDGSHWTLHD